MEEFLMILSLIKNHHHVWYKPPGLSRQKLLALHGIMLHLNKYINFHGHKLAASYKLHICISWEPAYTHSSALPLNILLMTMGLSPWIEPFPPSRLNPKPAGVFSRVTVQIVSSVAENKWKVIRWAPHIWKRYEIWICYKKWTLLFAKAL